jgi:hypothetical protein
VRKGKKKKKGAWWVQVESTSRERVLVSRPRRFPPNNE